MNVTDQIVADYIAGAYSPGGEYEEAGRDPVTMLNIRELLERKPARFAVLNIPCTRLLSTHHTREDAESAAAGDPGAWVYTMSEEEAAAVAASAAEAVTR